jgi:polar amino acid transport system substrate-binding protein
MPSSDLRAAHVVSGGALRLALFPSFFWRNDASGTPRGVGVTIAQALADSVGVTLDCAVHGSPPEVVEALAAGSADVALLGIERARAAAVDFSGPLMSADFTYLVPDASAVRAIADADRLGVRIALVRHHAMDGALQLNHASRVYAATPDAAFELLRAGSADVLAGIRPGLLSYARQWPDARVLDERYGRNIIALAVPKGVADWRAFVGEFAEGARADGIVRRTIEQAGLTGVQPE